MSPCFLGFGFNRYLYSWRIVFFLLVLVLKSDWCCRWWISTTEKHLLILVDTLIAISYSIFCF
jgi:hypothetical protein